MARKFIRERKYLLFQAGDVAEMLDVSARTINRWSKIGEIHFEIDGKSKWRVYSLDEVNRIREQKLMPPLTEDEAIEIFDNRHQ